MTYDNPMKFKDIEFKNGSTVSWKIPTLSELLGAGNMKGSSDLLLESAMLEIKCNRLKECVKEYKSIIGII